MDLVLRFHHHSPLHQLRRLTAAGDGRFLLLLPFVPDPIQPQRHPVAGEEEALRRRLRRRKWPLRRPPLPLSRPHHRPPHCHLHRPRHQASPLLPRPLPCPPPLQAPLQPLGPPSSRPFSSSSMYPYSELDSARDSVVDDDGTPTVTNLIRSDLKEVDPICKVIEELFASSNRNMEAVLDDCGFELTPSLVADVLERFRHRHKPTHRFFCWAGGRPGFAHDAEIYNKMLTVFRRTRQFETMVALLEEMGKEGFFTLDSFKTAIKAFAASREMKKSMGIFHLMKRFNFKAGLETFNCLIEALAKSELGKEAQELFERMKDQYPPDLRIYTLLRLGWCKLKNLLEARKPGNKFAVDFSRAGKPDILYDMAQKMNFQETLKLPMRSIFGQRE